MNLDMCCSHGILSMLLPMMNQFHDHSFDKSVKLVQILGKYNFTKKDLHIMMDQMNQAIDSNQMTRLNVYMNIMIQITKEKNEIEIDRMQSKEGKDLVSSKGIYSTFSQ